MNATELLALKAAIRLRDRMQCVDCQLTNDESRQRSGRCLDVHRLKPGSPYSMAGCVTVCRGCHRKRHRKPKMVNVRLPARIVRMARIVAAMRGMSTTDYINSVLEPVVMRLYRKAVRQMVAQAKREGKWPVQN